MPLVESQLAEECAAIDIRLLAYFYHLAHCLSVVYSRCLFIDKLSMTTRDLSIVFRVSFSR